MILDLGGADQLLKNEQAQDNMSLICATWLIL